LKATEFRRRYEPADKLVDRHERPAAFAPFGRTFARSPVNLMLYRANPCLDILYPPGYS
jgi:hypothetical protein